MTCAIRTLIKLAAINENQIKVSEILKLTPNKPLFGHVTKRHGGTIWLTFMKP